MSMVERGDGGGVGKAIHSLKQLPRRGLVGCAHGGSGNRHPCSNAISIGSLLVIPPLGPPLGRTPVDTLVTDEWVSQQQAVAAPQPGGIPSWSYWTARFSRDVTTDANNHKTRLLLH
ncbi:hypothetical protein Tco_0409429 [Tanacetum coccineum]